jgi:hypothetical protein
VSEHFRFRVQRVIIEEGRRFQLRVGMDGERDLEFIPVHQTAYAQRFPLKQTHGTEAEAHQEKDALLEWLKGPGASAVTTWDAPAG